MSTEHRSPEELARWMRSEHETLVELSQVIREHIARQPHVNRGDWLRGLKAAFDRLVLHLQRNFDGQESGGYLRLVVEARPTLSQKVEGLRQEHVDLRRMAERLRTDLNETEVDTGLWLADICARIQRFIAVVAQHDQRENMIALLVLNEDIGTVE